MNVTRIKHRRWHHISLLLSMFSAIVMSGFAAGEDRMPLSFSGDVVTASKYIWRGQRLTNDWSLQPSGTFGIGNLSINIWGNMDLTAVNEGDSLFIKENPNAPAGDCNGLQGHFSEVDYTFSYAFDAESAALDFGTIVYTFPDRSASLPATVEIYGGVTLVDLPLAPSATLYVDVDETGDSGSTGLYFLMAGGHQFGFGNSRFPGLDLSASLSFVNSGFSEFYYGASDSGPHDVSVSLTAPINLGERWSVGAFITYSALLGDFRSYQFQDPREVYLGSAGSPATFADTIWGGLSLSARF